MKRQAAQAAKEEKKDQKKAELERKKAAKVTTKKTLTVATKMCGALTNCWNSAAPTAMKAKELGLPVSLTPSTSPWKMPASQSRIAKSL